MSVRNDETGSAGAMGLLSVTSFLENVWLVSFSSSSIATCTNTTLCVMAIQYSWLPLRKSSVPS